MRVTSRPFYGQVHAPYNEPAPRTLNDDDRRQWIANDEYLYNWQRTSRLPMRMFLREYRKELDAYINEQLNKKPR